MPAGSTRPTMNPEQRDVQQSTYLFLLAASSEWQWCLFADQMSVWRFPHTYIPLTHKTHLLTLNWHTWDDFPSGEQETSGRVAEWECERERVQRMSGEHSLSRRSSPSMSPSHSVPRPLGQYPSFRLQMTRWCTPAWRVQNIIIRAGFLNKINMHPCSCHTYNYY